MPQYLDEKGNPIPAPQKASPVYLDDNGNPKPAGVTPTATLSAGKPESWVDKLSDDLKEGGNRTFVGRTLGAMQGRPADRGYSGLYSGVSPEAAEQVASPILGPLNIAKAVEDTPNHPIKSGLLGVIKGAAQTASLPLAFAGGPELDYGIDMIPSTKHAGQVFEDLNDVLATHPIKLTDKTLQPLLRATEIGTRGGTLPKPVSDLLTRSQGLEDMSYPEIRDYQSNLSDLSRTAKDSMNGKMLGQVGRVKGGLYEDIYNGLGPTGRADDYADAMKEFRRASQLRDLFQKSGKLGAKIGAGALGAGGLYEGYKALSK